MNRGERPALSETQTVIMAAGCWFGAGNSHLVSFLWPVPLWVGAAGVALGIIFGRPWLVLASVVCVAVASGYHSEQTYRPAEVRQIDQQVSLITDPRPFALGVQCRVRLDGGTRLDATAFGAQGVAIGQLVAGDRVSIVGTVTPIEESGWAKSNHLVGRLAISEVHGAESATGLMGAAELVRSTVTKGSDSVWERYQPLYLGLVVGDDRLQSEIQRARFRASGLSHLLAVSGQNVAFVLAVCSPLIQSLGRRTRFWLVVLILVVFAIVTRMEPSVVRATVTAGIATGATLAGHRQGGVRLLALTVAGLVIIDPFMVYSVGFQLSVSASAGILVLGPLIITRIRGPSYWVEPVSVTLSAQLGVLPLLLAYFGPVSVGSIPANLLAGWASGFVMMLGLTVGVLAGFMPEAIGAWVQMPANLGLWWLDFVSSTVPRLPMPRLGIFEIVIVACLGGGIWTLGSSHRPTNHYRLGLAVPLLAILVASVPLTPQTPTVLDNGYWIPPAGNQGLGVLIVEPRASRGLLDDILANRITSADVVVARSGSKRDSPIVRAVAGLVGPQIVFAAPQHQIVGGRRVTEPIQIDTGWGIVLVSPQPKTLTVKYPTGVEYHFQPAGGVDHTRSAET